MNALKKIQDKLKHIVINPSSISMKGAEKDDQKSKKQSEMESMKTQPHLSG